LAAFAAFMVSAPAAHASCSGGIVYGGGVYYGTSASVREGAPLAGGYRPGCDDAVAIDPATGARLTPLAGPTPVALHRIPGVPVRLGVALNGRAALAPGYLPQLAGHPLHKLFPSASKPASCGSAWRVRGKVQAPPLPGAPVYVTTGPAAFRVVTLVESTRVSGLTRDGLPYLAAGDAVDAVVRTCGGAIVAQRVARA
jgi:hypothetical protein